jgi:predicted O-methyltransferase YrrM
MHPVLAEILRSREVRTIDGQLRQLHSNIGEAEGKFIQDVIRDLKPKCSIEIGCAYGVSSLFICEALADVGAERHIIIDPYQLGSGHRGPDSGYEGIGLLNLKRAGLDRIVDFHAELSFRCLPRLLEQGVMVDFAFVDGMHTFDYAFVDFFFLDKMLRPGGVIIFDDYSIYPSIHKLCRYIVRNLPYSPIGPATGRWQTGAVKGALKAVLPSLPLMGRLLKPELTEPDAELGLPVYGLAGNIALRKRSNDVLGDGTNGTRRWDYHQSF